MGTPRLNPTGRPAPTISREGFLSPADLARFYREEHPGKFDDIEDRDLIRAIEVEDPESYRLIDPLLIGAENLPRPAAPPPAPRMIPPPPSPSTFDIAATTGLRVVPAIAGAVGGGLLTGGPWGVAGGGMGGAALGETAAQKYEQEFGPREDYNVPVIAMESFLGAFNPAIRATTTLGRIGTQAAYGSALGGVGGAGRTLIEEGRLPTGGELLTQTLAGGAFGGLTQGGVEAAGALGRAGQRMAPSFGEATGALPTEAGPAPSAIDQLIAAQAAAQQYQAEEARLAGELTRMFGKSALVTGTPRADLHTALQTKDYLEQLARLRQTPVPIPPMDPTTWSPEIPAYLNRAIGIEGPRLLPEAAGPSAPGFVGYPPGVEPNLDITAAQPPRIVTTAPPPSPLEEALAASLAQPPGPPRLMPRREQWLALEPPPGAAGMAELPPPRQGELFRQPRPSFGGRLEAPSTAELGGAPPSLEQPRLPGILRPGGVDRVYPEGPNVGPRRRGEAHGQPRTLRRQVEREGKTTYETYPSSRPAEDPGMYPPEVRRELAAMAWELESFPYEKYQGGVTRGQLEALTEETGSISEAIATARRKKVSAGGAIAGAPVYHQVIESAEGAFRHATRADMLQAITDALRKGKGSGLTDAAAAVARARLQERAGGKLARTSKILAKRGDEGDLLIDWVDPLGRPPSRDLSPYEQAAREMDDGEILAADRVYREAGGDEGINFETIEWFDAARAEGVRRGLITPEQLELRMLGPGGEGGVPIKDFEGRAGEGLVRSAESAVAQLSPEALDRVLATYRAHAGDVPGGGRMIRQTAGRPLWGRMSRQEQVQELIDHIRQDLETVRGEIQGKPIDYLLNRALDPLDPLSTFYGEVLRAAGAEVEPGRVRLSPELRTRHTSELAPPPPAGPRKAESNWVKAARERAAAAATPEAEMRRRATDRWLEEFHRREGDILPTSESGRRTELERQRIEQEYRREHGLPLRREGDIAAAEGPPPAYDPDVEYRRVFGTEPPPRPTTPAAEEGPPPQRPGWLERLMSERGVLIFDVPAGDRTGIKRWLKAHEEEHGGEAWYSRAEQAVEDGDWDRAWKVLASQSMRSYTKAFAAAKTPQEEAALRAAVKGTPLQQDLAAQIVAVGRQGQQKRPAPKVEGLPPSYKVTTRQMGQGMTIGPAGIIQPGPPTKPVPRGARAQTLDKEIMDTFVEEMADVPEMIHLVRGNRDAALRLGRQVTDLVVQGQVKFDPAAFPGMTREEVGRQYMHTLSEAGRILGAHGRYVQEYADELYEMADRMDMGAALAGSLGGGRRAPLGARGRVSSPAAAEALDRIAQRTAVPQVAQNLLLNDLQRPPKRSIGDRLMDSQYAFLTAGFATAVRNAYTTVGRYGWDLLDHALTVPFAMGLGEQGAGRTAGAILRERVGARHTSFAVSPLRAAKAETFEQIYNLVGGTLQGLSPTDARRTLKILSEYPDEAAHMIGWAGGEDLAQGGSGSGILDKLLDPKVQRWLTLWNRAQEFTGRGLTFDTHFRAQLRARGLDPVEVLRTPDKAVVAAAVGGERELQDMLRFASNAALEMTWAGQLANRSIPSALVNFVQSYWPAKLVQRFPRFNFSAAPRWIYDHSPAALLDLVRLPFDYAGWTSTGKVMGGGRLYRGLKAQQYQTDIIPGIRSEITRTQGELGTAVLDLQATSREWTVRQRQVARLQARAQQGIPGTQTALDSALELRDQLARRRDQLKGQIRTHKTTIQDLTAQEEKLWKEVQNATGISAPTWSSWMARMTSGTFGLLGAAVVVRSQPEAEGTRYYQYRIEREGQDPFMLDLRAAAPFVQYLMVADVLVDFWRHTNWEQAEQDAEAAGPTGRGNPLNWTNAVWNNYEGKYTRQLLASELTNAFLSISRAAGTTLTIADLMTRNGWPSPGEAGDAIIGTIGQFLAGYATPLGQLKDVASLVSEEEALVRTTPRPSATDPSSWSYPLAEGLGRVPGLNRLIPPTYSQTTGQPVRGVYPAARAVTGIGGSQADFIQEEIRRVGLPGSSYYFRETGDKGFDDLLAQTYARIVNAELPTVLEDPEYQQLGTPARQRDYLQRIFPLLKRAALGEVKELLGLERVEEAQTTGEELRRKRRQAALVETLEGAEPPGGESAPFEEPEPPPPAPAPAAPF